MAETFLAMCWVNRFRSRKRNNDPARAISRAQIHPLIRRRSPLLPTHRKIQQKPSNRTSNTRAAPGSAGGYGNDDSSQNGFFAPLRRGGLGCSELTVARRGDAEARTQDASSPQDPPTMRFNVSINCGLFLGHDLCYGRACRTV